MAQDDKISSVLLQYNVDRASLNQAILASAKVRGEMQYVATTAKQQTLEINKAGEAVRNAFGSVSSNRLKELSSNTQSATKQMVQLKEAATGAQLEIKKLSSIKAADIVDPELGDVIGGGGGFSRASIGRFGAKIRNLPSTQIPGTSLATDAIGNIMRLIGGLPTPLIAVGAGFAAVGASVVLLNASLTESKAKLDAAAIANTKYYDLLREKTTSGELQTQINDLVTKLDADQAELDTINKSFASGFNAATDQFGNFIGGVLYSFSQVSNADDNLVKRADELKASVAADVETLKTLRNAQDSDAISKNDLKAATEAATKAEQELAAVRANNAVKLDQARIQSQIEAANLAANGTEKQIQDRLDSLAREKEVLNANLPIMQANLATVKEGTKEYDTYKNQIDNTRSRLAELDTAMLILAGDTLQAVKANDAAAVAEKKRVDSIKTVEAYNQDIARINDQTAQKQTELATKYADKQVEIAAKAVEDAENLLTKLETRLADLATDVGRDLDKDTRKANFDALQDQIKFQQDEVAETQKHYQDLERIRRQALAKEFEQGLDRDFAGLAASRRATAEQVSESNIQFNQDRQARLDSFAAKRSDEAAEFEFERQERIIQFEQDVSDARAQYNRERQLLAESKNKQLAQAKTAYDKELALTQSKYRAELTARDAAVRAELQLIQAGNTARLQLEAQLQQQYLTILRNAANSAGMNVSAGASGAGFSSLPGGTGGVNASGNAAVGGIGGLFGFSGGRSQNAAAASGGVNLGGLNISITTGASPSQVAALVPAIGKVVNEELTKYHRSIYGK